MNANSAIPTSVKLLTLQSLIQTIQWNHKTPSSVRGSFFCNLYVLYQYQHTQCTYQRNIDALSHSYCCRGKTVLHILSVCVRACVCSSSNRACNGHRPTVICDVCGHANFSALSHKRRAFGRRFLQVKCEYWSSKQLWSETFLILIRTHRPIIIHVYRSSWKVLVILVRFLNET
jgi:hypothetical protein